MHSLRLLLATKNTKKVQEIRQVLADVTGIELVSAADFPDVAEPEETGQTFYENAQLKAKYYAGITGILSLADDSGLCVDALSGRPGVQSSRYAASDSERINRLLLELADVPDAQRTARFECVMVLAEPEIEIAATTGTLEGLITRDRYGTGGFGYDPVFQVKEAVRSLAELPAEHKNRISHRGIALRKMLPAIQSLISPPSGHGEATDRTPMA